MSREELQLIRDMFDRWRAGGPATEALDEHIEWDASVFPDAGVEHGHEGVRRFLRRWLGTWEDYELSVERLIDAGDQVVAFTRERGRGKGSDVRVELEATMLFTVRDRKVVRFRAFLDRSAGLLAAGFTESEAQELADSGRT